MPDCLVRLTKHGRPNPQPWVPGRYLGRIGADDQVEVFEDGKWRHYGVSPNNVIFPL